MNHAKRTLVLGASTNSTRASFQAVERLAREGIEVIPVGIREGDIHGIPIIQGRPAAVDVHTVTLYLNPQRQKDYYDYIFSLHPRRIIFNPGTENPELIHLARDRGIECEIACTLVLLAVGQY